MKIGQIVTVLKATDETMPDDLLGKSGQVKYFDYGCGCGQSYPDDPMVGVHIDGKVYEFWTEELLQEVA